MIDIDTFITGLQFFWIKRLLSNERQYFGSTWPKNLAQNITNMVWKEALLSWACLLDINIPDEENRKLSSPIWYNPKVSKMKLYLPQWFNKGIIFVSDLTPNENFFHTVT